jgi:flagellar basal-body rod modification protein FlgD
MADLLQTQSVSSTSTAAAALQQSILGKDDFLKLLIAQMKNQDPLDPMKGTDFAAQLAQFSSVEQLANINDNLSQSLNANQLLTQAISNALAATLIGKQAKATGNAFTFNGNTSVQLGYTLPVDANTVTLTISDAQGTVVRTIQGAAGNLGDNVVPWDGRNNQGLLMPMGQYTFSVNATDDAGAAITSSSFVTGTISGVRYKSDGTVFVVDGVEIPLSKILEIISG